MDLFYYLLLNSEDLNNKSPNRKRQLLILKYCSKFERFLRDKDVGRYSSHSNSFLFCTPKKEKDQISDDLVPKVHWFSATTNHDT